DLHRVLAKMRGSVLDDGELVETGRAPALVGKERLMAARLSGIEIHGDRAGQDRAGQGRSSEANGARPRRTRGTAIRADSRTEDRENRSCKGPASAGKREAVHCRDAVRDARRRALRRLARAGPGAYGALRSGAGRRAPPR